MANKQVSTEVLQELTNKIQEIVNNYCWNLEYFTPTEVDDFFQASADEVTFYNGLINDKIESQNFLWSSKHVAEKIAQSIIEANGYTDNMIKNISSIQLEWCATSLPTTAENNKIYILPVASGGKTVNTLNIWNNTSNNWVSIGNLEMDITQFYNKSEIDTKMDLKANKTEVVANDKIVQTLDSATNSSDTVLSTSGLQVEMDKKANEDDVIKKISLVTSIDSSSTEDTIPSSKTVYEELDGKLTNSYYKNNESKKGISFYNNADGSHFTFRPFLPENVLQITKNDTEALLDIHSDGTIQTKGNRNINDLVVAYKNVVTNIYHVDISTSESPLNNAGIVTSATPNKPSDMDYGIREVLWVAQNKVIIRVTGVDTSGMPAIWINRYDGTNWTTWRKL